MDQRKHIDPVCGMTVDPATAAGKSEHNGRTTYFCSAGCKAKFDADPSKYLTAAVGSRLSAVGQQPAQHKDPVCGMSVDPSTAAGKTDYHGQTIYFCSLGCKAKFDADPEKYLAPPDSREPTADSHDATVQHVDPVCGMTVDPAHAAGMSERAGETIYFCNPACKAKFDANPEKYLASSDSRQPTAVPPPTATPRQRRSTRIPSAE